MSISILINKISAYIDRHYTHRGHLFAPGKMRVIQMISSMVVILVLIILVLLLGLIRRL